MNKFIALSSVAALCLVMVAPVQAQSSSDDDDAFAAASPSAQPLVGTSGAAMAIIAGVGLAVILAVSNSSSGTR